MRTADGSPASSNSFKSVIALSMSVVEGEEGGMTGMGIRIDELRMTRTHNSLCFCS